MKNRLFIAASACAVFTTAGANAAHLLDVDLTVANQITITAVLDGFSAATISGSDGTGFLLADFYAGPPTTFLNETLVSGNLTSAQNTSDGSPNLFRSGSSNGLNIFSYTDDATSDFVAGAVAFSGTATWSLDADDYLDMVAGVSDGFLGDIYFPADTDDDIAGATLLGTYLVSVPAPGAFALFGLAAVGVGRRRRA